MSPRPELQSICSLLQLTNLKNYSTQLISYWPANDVLRWVIIISVISALFESLIPCVAIKVESIFLNYIALL